MAELKPCPACGGPSTQLNTLVSCTKSDCQIIGPNCDPDGAKWNALPRRGDAAAAAEMERERDVCCGKPEACDRACVERGRWLERQTMETTRAESDKMVRGMVDLYATVRTLARMLGQEVPRG